MRATRLTQVLTACFATLVASSAGHAQVKVSTSGGDVITFTQKNVVDHMIVGDSIEVEVSKLAAMRTQNVAVRDLANMLVADHRGHLDNLRKLAGKRDIGREANSADTSGAMSIRMVDRLRTMEADSGFDRAFVRQQIRHHTREIATLKMLRPAARDDDLQKDIDRTLPVLERHLATAKNAAAQLGVPWDTTHYARPSGTDR
jgi:predicted outer membrane protein